MKDYNKIHLFLISILASISSLFYEIPQPYSTAYANKPIATDSRIKTFVFSESEVFRVVVHYGYQTSIEFAEGEEIQTISVGNNYAWQLSPLGRRLFIKPLEENILTNMTIITNKRTYQLELQSKSLYDTMDDELVYVIRFFYPDDYDDSIKPQLANDVKELGHIPTIKPYNFNYTVTGPFRISPSKVFDDGIKTFFYFDNYPTGSLPTIASLQEGKWIGLQPKKIGKYLMVNVLAEQFKIAWQGQNAEVVNNELSMRSHGKRKK